jgi:mycothiol synthase
VSDPAPDHHADPAATFAVVGPASGVTRYPAAPGSTDGLTVTWHGRGQLCEAVLTWTGADLSGDLAAAAGADLRRTATDLAAGPEPARLMLAADHPGRAIHPLPEAVADAAGLTDRRDLFQLHRNLPVPADHPVRADLPVVATRAFEPGVDDDAWIRTNNRAFADHPDQGRETPATLRDRMAEPWFDPADFLVLDDADRPGELAGSCWTKIHPADPTTDRVALGEIYVIGVDPARQGDQLGPALVLAGLDHLASRGLATTVLYVDESNTGARRLYDRLGFTVHARRRVYTAPATSSAPS